MAAWDDADLHTFTFTAGEPAYFQPALLPAARCRLHLNAITRGADRAHQHLNGPLLISEAGPGKRPCVMPPE